MRSLCGIFLYLSIFTSAYADNYTGRIMGEVPFNLEENSLCFGSTDFSDIDGVVARYGEAGGACHGFSEIVAAFTNCAEFENTGIRRPLPFLEHQIENILSANITGCTRRVTVTGYSSLNDLCNRNKTYFKELVLSENSRLFFGNSWRQGRRISRMRSRDNLSLEQNNYETLQRAIRSLRNHHAPIIFEHYGNQRRGDGHSYTVYLIRVTSISPRARGIPDFVMENREDFKIVSFSISSNGSSEFAVRSMYLNESRRLLYGENAMGIQLLDLE